MIEQAVLQTGAIGGVCIFFMSLTWFFVKKVTAVVDNNTKALTLVYETISHCPKVKKAKV